LTKIQCLKQQAFGHSFHLIPLYYVTFHDFCHGGCELDVCFVDAVYNNLLLVILLCAMEFLLWKLHACKPLFDASYLAVCNGVYNLKTVCMFVYYWITLHDNSLYSCCLL